VFVGGALFLRHRKAHVIRDTDTVVLADLANSTGDAVFDDTLKQALAISLRQSPFLKILPNEKVITTLRLMTLPPNKQLTPTIARKMSAFVPRVKPTLRAQSQVSGTNTLSG
jgi:eukaryotic-like serine/threonine-protein kinase